MKRPEHAVTIVRNVAASTDAVYAAWTDPVLMRQWMATIVDADVRVGGRFRIEVHEKDGTINGFSGEYLVLEPGRRIVKTFRHDSTAPDTYVDGRVEVTLKALGPERTELTLVNGWDGLGATADETAGVERGWHEWIDLLDAALAASATRPG